MIPSYIQDLPSACFFGGLSYCLPSGINEIAPIDIILRPVNGKVIIPSCAYFSFTSEELTPTRDLVLPMRVLSSVVYTTRYFTLWRLMEETHRGWLKRCYENGKWLGYVGQGLLLDTNTRPLLMLTREYNCRTHTYSNLTMYVTPSFLASETMEKYRKYLFNNILSYFSCHTVMIDGKPQFLRVEINSICPCVSIHRKPNIKQCGSLNEDVNHFLEAHSEQLVKMICP